MREQRKRKALYVNRREELYPAALLEKERSAGKTAKTKRTVRKAQPASRRRSKPAR